MSRPDQYRMDGNTFRLPISADPDRHAWLWIPHPVTGEEWDRMLALLGTFRDGLVDEAGCCIACRGTGRGDWVTPEGCPDCYGTGHCHPREVDCRG